MKSAFLTALASAAACWSTVTSASIPGCAFVAPPQTNLTNVTTAQLRVPARPFGIAYAHSGDIAFVGLNETLGVLNTSTLSPSLLHEIPLPFKALNSSVITKYLGIIEGATGIALTHDGRHVLVTAFSPYLIVLDAAKAAANLPDAVVGLLEGTAAAGASAIEVTVTRDGKYAFVSQEDVTAQASSGGAIEVFELHRPTVNGSITGTSRGYITLGLEVVGTALSPDGRYLYATSENRTAGTSQGSISVLDVEMLKSHSHKALLRTVDAGCGAVRTIVSADGKVVWVTARESNYVLAFDAAKLLSHPHHALIASVQVGTSPVGLIFARDGSRILTANSNRFADNPILAAQYANATAGISIVDVHAALRGEDALLGQIPTGKFPRELAISPDGKTVLVSVYGSLEVLAIDVDSLP